MRSTLFALVLTLAAAPLAAQATVSGEVLDARSGEPVSGAVVTLPDAGARAVTDAEGRFQLRRVTEGEQRVLVSRVGYTDWEETAELSDGGTLAVRLDSDPVVLEAVRVTIDRLEQRRRAYAGRITVLDQREIAVSAASSALELVLYRALDGATLCGAGSVCVHARSARNEPVRLVIDDHVLPGTAGTESLLRSYHPSQIHTVETLEGGRTVRIYTNWYIESVRGPLPPLRRGF